MPQVGILGVKGIPYQGDQMAKIVEVLGTPEGWSPREVCSFVWGAGVLIHRVVERWPDIISMPDYPQFALQARYVPQLLGPPPRPVPPLGAPLSPTRTQT